MTKKMLLLGAVAVGCLAVAAGTLLRPGLADGPEPFAGSWDVVDVQPAPWVESGQEFPVNEEIAKGRITFMAKSVQAPDFLNCDNASFELTTVPPEFLFQGGLTDPATQAAALGYKGGEIHNLAMSCISSTADISMDFSMIADGVIVFALDNSIFRMERAAE
jgi:hypothetical protein